MKLWIGWCWARRTAIPSFAIALIPRIFIIHFTMFAKHFAFVYCISNLNWCTLRAMPRISGHKLRSHIWFCVAFIQHKNLILDFCLQHQSICSLSLFFSLFANVLCRIVRIFLLSLSNCSEIQTGKHFRQQKKAATMWRHANSKAENIKINMMVYVQFHFCLSHAIISGAMFANNLPKRVTDRTEIMTQTFRIYDEKKNFCRSNKYLSCEFVARTRCVCVCVWINLKFFLCDISKHATCKVCGLWFLCCRWWFPLRKQ